MRASRRLLTPLLGGSSLAAVAVGAQQWSGPTTVVQADAQAQGKELTVDSIPPRNAQFQRIKEHSSKANPFDVLVCGGGATGTGCAFDAQTRCVLCLWGGTREGGRAREEKALMVLSVCARISTPTQTHTHQHADTHTLSGA